MNKDEFKSIIEPVVNRNDCILWGIEILRGKKGKSLNDYVYYLSRTKEFREYAIRKKEFFVGVRKRKYS